MFASNYQHVVRSIAGLSKIGTIDRDLTGHSTLGRVKVTVAAHSKSLKLYNVNGAFAGIKIWTVADKCTKQPT
jgi:hypothetical protein